ncbi:hypothetical protein NHX12_004012 [Muraenolepis orangiensis]|uniref:Cadherin domain-containing protein n=1 Tax=Muraenolepis orangiensis TaxID=630683 RepID=A0A9Q0DTN1_9TELE|nr:hypothetical protein NHX12_004012 [Muraenolepis orangiensis]
MFLTGGRGVLLLVLLAGLQWTWIPEHSRWPNTIDRESPVLQDGIYNVTVKAVDLTMKSATGTVIILVEDENDHVPDLPNKDRILCEKDGQLGSVEVNAVDADQSPFSGPFNFETLKDHNAN